MTADEAQQAAVEALIDYIYASHVEAAYGTAYGRMVETRRMARKLRQQELQEAQELSDELEEKQ